MSEELKSPSVKSTSAPKKSNSVLWIVIIISIVFLGLMGGGIYFGWKWWKNRTTTSVKNLTIPENCPKNIPVYPKSKIISITCKPEASSIESVINVDQKKVKAWYKTAVEKKGWTIRSEDSGSYLFDNDLEIGKVSLSSEKKNTIIKFLTAKRTSSAPVVNNSSSKSSSGTANLDSSGSSDSFGIFDSLINWEDYFDSTQADYSSPTDEGTEFYFEEPADEVLETENTDDSEEVDTEDSDSGEPEEVVPEDTDDTNPDDTTVDEPEDGGDSDTTDDSDDDGWTSDKQYLQVPTH